MVEWFHARGGRQHGPISEAELRELIAAGALGADVLVWREGLPEWLPVSELPELSVLAPPRAAPAAEQNPYMTPASASTVRLGGGGVLDIGRALSEGWQAFSSNFLIGLLGVGLLFGASLSLTIVDALAGTAPALGWIGNVFLFPILQAGFVLVGILAVRGPAPGAEDLFRPFRTSYFPLVGVTLLYFAGLFAFGLVAALGFGVVTAMEAHPALLIVPAVLFGCLAIYLALRLYFTVQFIVDRGLGPIAALQASWAATRGQVLSLLGLMLVAGCIIFAGVLLLLVGVIPAVWLVTCMIGSAYLQLTES